MPRTKESRNPLGSIFQKTVVKDGKRIQVYDVRKRTARTDDRGQPIRDERGRKTYRTRSVRCYSYSEALATLGNMTALIARERQPARAVRTLAQLVDYYRQEYLKPAVFVRDTQIAGYRQRTKTIDAYLDDYLKFFGASTQLSHITYEDLRRYSERLATTPVKFGKKTKLPEISTVNRKLAYLRRVLNVARRLRWIDHNPFGEGKPLINTRAEHARERILTFEEEQRLLDACVDYDHVKYERKAVQIKYRRRGKWVRFTRPAQTIEYEQDNQRSHIRLPVLLAIDGGRR
jgi:hypothetical protein